MCERWDFCKGLWTKVARHKNRSKDYIKDQGSIGKTRSLLPPPVRNEQRGRGLQDPLGVSNRQGYAQLGTRARCKTERGEGGDHGEVLTSVGEEGSDPDLEEDGSLRMARHTRRGGTPVHLWRRGGAAGVRFVEVNPKAAPACSNGFHVHRIDDESPCLALLVRTACGRKNRRWCSGG
jgi:hypothetical protein